MTWSRRAVIASSLGSLLTRGASQASASQCVEVELYPGYPGFRGYITGLFGYGDVACLAELEAASPSFDRAEVDRENARAAARLGLAGDAELWTWENWLSIEAERDILPRTCYVCALKDAGDRPATFPSSIARDDPRLLLGDLTTTFAISQYGSAFGDLVQNDQDLHALIGMVGPGYWNASQMLEGYEIVANDIATTGNWFDFDGLLDSLLSQGGYAPTPVTAAPKDQAFMIMAATPVLSRLLMPLASRIFLERTRTLPSRWLGQTLSGTPDQPFVDFFADAMRDIGLL